MFRNVSCRHRWPFAWPAGLLVAAILAFPGPVAAQPGKAAPPPQQVRLKQAIEAQFRVLPVQKGILLVPRVSRPGVGSIELSDGAIAVNGTLVTGAELKQRLGSDADLVAELSYLGQPAREALFFGGGTAKPEPPAPPLAPEANPPEPSPPAEPPFVERQFSRRSSARVRIGGAVHVDRDESVDGAVVVIFGSAVIDGQVSDAVVVVGGNARLGRDSDVRGDVTVVGGTIDRDPGAKVGGEVNEIAFGFPSMHLRPLRRPFWRFRPLWLHWATPPINLFGTFLRLILFGLLAGLVMLVAADPVERIEHAAASEPWKAGLIGLLAELLFVPLLVLTVIILAISIIGIPLLLLVPFALLALLAALLLGFTGVAYRAGRWAQQRFGWGRQSRYVLLAAGLGMVWGLTVLGRIVALAGWPVWILSAGLIGVGFLVEYVAWTVGLGATLLSRFGTRGARPAMAYEDTVPPPAQPGGDVTAGTNGPA